MSIFQEISPTGFVSLENLDQYRYCLHNAHVVCGLITPTTQDKRRSDIH